jgi:hypothetical protein
MISLFLIELKDSMATLTAISYPACWPTHLPMTMLDSKEVRHKAYNPEVVLMTKPPWKTAAVAVSLLCRPSELDTQQEASPMEIVNQMAFCVSTETTKQ